MTTTTAPTALAASVPRASTRHRLLAAGVLAAPLLLSINSAFHPTVDITAASLLEGAASSPGRWYVVHLVAATGAMLGVVAAVGLRTLVVGPGRRLSAVALGLSAVGAPILALVFAIEAAVLRLAAGLEAPAALALAEGYVGSPDFYAVPPAIALVTLGNLLMGIALARSGTVPRQLSVLYCLATVATAVAPPGTLVGPIAFGVMSLVSAFFALAIVGALRR